MQLNNTTDEFDALKHFKDEKLDRMEIHIKKTQNDITQIDGKVNEIYNAVVGNKKMGNIGISDRLIEIELKAENLKKEIEELRENKVINGVYIKQMLAISGIVFTFIILFYLKSSLK